MDKNKHILLDEMNKELPFVVPENYFDQFATQMDAQIGLKPVSVRVLLKPWLYMAAMFVGLLLVGQVFYSRYQTNTAQNAENYELYVLSQVDETALMDFYVDQSAK